MTTLSIPKLTDELLSAFSVSDANCFFIEGDNIGDKASFLREFSGKLKFPEYFGFNWDAFSDCLTDLSWLNLNSGLLIIYNNPHKFRKNNPNEWKIANDILLDAMDYWKESGKSMIIVFL